MERKCLKMHFFSILANKQPEHTTAVFERKTFTCWCVENLEQQKPIARPYTKNYASAFDFKMEFLCSLFYLLH